MHKHRVVLGALAISPWLFLSPGALARDLTFEDRVNAQEAIERIYYSHQIGANRPFEEAVPRSVLEVKVRAYISKSRALASYWNTPVTDGMLQAELDRIVSRTRYPGRLREVYAALGNSTFLLKECYVRPFLVDRLVRHFIASDERIQGAQREHAEELQRRLLNDEPSVYVNHPDRTVVAARVLEQATTGEGISTPENAAEMTAEMTIDLASGDYQEWRSRAPHDVGEVGPVSESDDAFLIRAVLSEDDSSARVATYLIPKIDWEAWSPSSSSDPETVVLQSAARSDDDSDLQNQLEREDAFAPCVADDVWHNGTLDDVPDPRASHSAVWTGSVMLIWGGVSNLTYLNSGARYDPLSDTWSPISRINAPAPRRSHTAVWTGGSMLIWGGFNESLTASFYLGSGGRYDPVNDTWTAMTLNGAPPGRIEHTAIWTGSRMVVWGGRYVSGGNYVWPALGGRYDPIQDSWAPTSVLNAPALRDSHTAVWSGSLMVVWGGYGPTAPYLLKSGAKYDPVADTWLPITTLGAPSGRRQHGAVWRDGEMIVWGGEDGAAYLNTGGRYDIAGDSWSATTTLNAPSGRRAHSAIWSGERMIVWGGEDNHDALATGGQYDPVADEWTTAPVMNGPSPRLNHTAVWAGDQMIVWGGDNGLGRCLNSGARLNPVSGTWTSTSTGDAPARRLRHTVVWTGNTMLVWGGGDFSLLMQSGGRYDPVADAWMPMSFENAPSPRVWHTAVWTGSVMVVWGGWLESQALGNGGRYDPVADTWLPVAMTEAPAARWDHTAVWTGRQMIVWGGFGSGWRNSGGRYDPINDTWKAVSTAGAPSARTNHSAVWSGSRMIIWGGSHQVTPSSSVPTNTGGRYDPINDAWIATSLTNAPTARTVHSAVWTGTRMVIWGGWNGSFALNTGGRYDPVNNAWLSTSVPGSPTGRYYHTVVWTGDHVAVWGGFPGNSLAPSFATGARYDPGSDTWVPTSTVMAPAGRSNHSAVWTGSFMIVWGGVGGTALNSGGMYSWGHSIDHDNDGVSECQGDCNDAVPDINPGAMERCNGVDDNCDGEHDEGLDIGAACTEEVDGCHRVQGTKVCGASGEVVCSGQIEMYDGTPPEISCPPTAVLECPAFAVSAGSATATDECDQAPLIAHDASTMLPLGSSTLLWTATDASGNSAMCEQSIRVQDTIAPTLAVSSDSPVLWPPNHELVPVHVSWHVEDLCDPLPAVALISATSSEPDDSPGQRDGDTVGDIAGADLGTLDAQVELRAERNGHGSGRVYELIYRAVDASGNATPGSTVVTVPHDQGSGPEPLLMRVEPDNTAGMVRIHWAGVAGATGYDIISSSLSQVQLVNHVLWLGAVKVLARGTMATSFSEGAAGQIPPLGEGLFYLVQPRNERDGIGYGAESAPWPRVPASCDGGCP